MMTGATDSINLRVMWTLRQGTVAAAFVAAAFLSDRESRLPCRRPVANLCRWIKPSPG